MSQITSIQILVDDIPNGGGVLIAGQYLVTLKHVITDQKNNPHNSIKFCFPQFLQTVFDAELSAIHPLSCPGVIEDDALVLFNVLEQDNSILRNVNKYKLRKPLHNDLIVKTKGFPQHNASGEWQHFNLDGVINPVCTQVSWPTNVAKDTEPGFSGCPVITPDDEFVLGLLGWDRVERRLAYFVNAQQILIAFPLLKPIIDTSANQRHMISQSQNYARLSCEIQLITALGKQTISISDELYIEREIESDLGRHLLKNYQQQSRGLTVVSGEAGVGKTSLLTRVYYELVAQIGEPYVWLIRASLLGGEQSVSAAFYERMLSAINASLFEIIILIDTIDLLLQSDAQALATVEKLITLQEAGATIACSSRVYEFENHLSTVYQDLVGTEQPLKNYKLRAYTDTELPKAIASHVRCFYIANAAGQSVDEHIEKICAVTHRGTPLDEICRNPLTLRMLFSVYAPQEVNHHEVNTFKLYDDFWSFRVVKDRRGFSNSAEPIGDDCSELAVHIALSMLCMGSTELDINSVSQWQQQLETLVNRGVLVYPSPSSISFFHQTFFEHTAARGLVNLPGGLQTIAKKVIEQPNNLYLLPIFEQAILLGFRQAGQKHIDAIHVIDEVVQNTALTLVNSCSYIYVHTTTLNNNHLKTIIDKVILVGSESVQCSFLTLLANIPSSRLNEAYEVLTQLWDMNNWRIQENICELILKLNVRNPNLFASFFYSNGLNEALNCLDLGNSISAKRLSILVDCYSALIHLEPKQTFSKLITCFKRIRQQISGTSLLTKILKIINKNINLFDVHITEKTIIPLLLEYEYAENFRIRNYEFQNYAGHLICCVSKNSTNTAQEFYQRFYQLDRKVPQQITFSALSHFILKEPEYYILQLFDIIKGENSVKKRFSLYSITLSGVIQAIYSERENKKNHWELIKNFIKNQFNTSEAVTQNHIIAMLYSLPYEIQGSLIYCIDNSSENQWKEHDRLFKLVVVAAINNCKSALESIQKLKFISPWKEHLISQFLLHGATDPKVFVLLLNTMESDISLLTTCYRVLDQNKQNSHLREISNNHQINLNIFFRLEDNTPTDLFESKINLLSSFISMDLDIIELPTIDLLTRHYDKTCSRDLKCAIARYWLAYCKHKQELFENEYLQRILLKCDDCRTELILMELAAFSNGTQEIFCSHFEAILDRCFRSEIGLTINFLPAIRLLFDAMLDRFGSSITLEHFMKFLILIDKNFSVKQKKKAAHKLLTLSSKICTRLNIKQLNDFIAIARKVDRFIGRVVVDSACKTRLKDCKDVILNYIQDPLLADELKEMIRKYIHHHYRTGWSNDWFELHQLMPKI